MQVNSSEIHPFNELPEALVEELLNQCGSMGDTLSHSFRNLLDNKGAIRNDLADNGLLKHDSDLLTNQSYPTTCGVDGAYTLERLLSTDMVAVAAVAVEGLTPPSETRHWEYPHHLCEVLPTKHHDKTGLVSKAIMLSMELELANSAPHDVIFLDGSFTTPLINIQQALYTIDEVDSHLSDILFERMKDTMEAYETVVHARRSDRQFVSVPKYTSHNQIAKILLKDGVYEDRALLSFILSAGEYIRPFPFKVPDSMWSFAEPLLKEMGNLETIIDGMRNLYVVYYRPFIHSPTFRLELPQSVATDRNRLCKVFEAIKLQSGTPGIFESYPLYLADRMVKQMGRAVPAIRKATTQEMLQFWDEAEAEIYLLMHGYRTETGR
ncbi:MAG TPA: DNA double-strand break repair nuclease NurA [Methanoculleus thermophilus]|nr:DNA double-strand break repair nuclease NurA [Methanoculleus thermophilus]